VCVRACVCACTGAWPTVNTLNTNKADLYKHICIFFRFSRCFGKKTDSTFQPSDTFCRATKLFNLVLSKSRKN